MFRDKPSCLQNCLVFYMMNCLDGHPSVQVSLITISYTNVSVAVAWVLQRGKNTLSTLTFLYYISLTACLSATTEYHLDLVDDISISYIDQCIEQSHLS